MRTVLVLGLIVAASHAEPVEWLLAPSDFLRYERKKATVKQGKETLGAGRIATVHGHDLRGGQYQPVTPARGDLPVIFAFRLPPPGEGSGRVALKVKLRDTIRLRVAGTLEATAQENGDVALVGRYRFASRGREEEGDRYEIHGGEATVRMTFERARGLMRGGRVEIAYRLEKLEPKKGEKPKQVRETWVVALKKVVRVAGGDFRKQVNAAIARGVKRLAEQQREEHGDYPPHGKYEIGTTALCILTLCACDVPPDDPRVAPALAWLFEQEPVKNYDRSVALMAVDRAYTPPSEILRAHRGQVTVFERDLSPRRRAWCERVAEALERSVRSPGSWDYKDPGGGGRFRVTARTDSSNTQYAVLGLRAAARLGIRADDQTWLGVVRHFQQVREDDGRRGAVRLVREGESLGEEQEYRVRSSAGYRYRVDSRLAWGSMACAAISSLAIVRDELRRTKSGRLTSALEKEIEQMMLGGWAWLDRHWAMDRHPGHPSNNWYYYYLYSLERAGILDRVKRVGGKAWYFEGAAQLLERQNKNGGWNEGGGEDVSETCFALLFLKRATAPPLTQSK